MNFAVFVFICIIENSINTLKVFFLFLHSEQNAKCKNKMIRLDKIWQNKFEYL